jgi:hypothetical protein
MNRSTAPAASRTHHVMAIGLGLFLGHAVAVMAQQREGSWLAFVMATVFIASSAASYVLFVLGQREGLPKDVRNRLAYGLVGAIGAGVLFALQAAELFS